VCILAGAGHGAIIDHSGIIKGYAEYWQAPINAYFSHKSTIINIVCNGTALQPQPFLVNTSDYYISSKSSFFIAYKASSDCSALIHTLQPDKATSTKWFTVFFFNYDIGKQLAEQASITQ
jgi:hypothetical protein